MDNSDAAASWYATWTGCTPLPEDLLSRVAAYLYRRPPKHVWFHNLHGTPMLRNLKLNETGHRRRRTRVKESVYAIYVHDRVRAFFRCSGHMGLMLRAQLESRAYKKPEWFVSSDVRLLGWDKKLVRKFSADEMTTARGAQLLVEEALRVAPCTETYLEPFCRPYDSYGYMRRGYDTHAYCDVANLSRAYIFEPYQGKHGHKHSWTATRVLGRSEESVQLSFVGTRWVVQKNRYTSWRHPIWSHPMAQRIMEKVGISNTRIKTAFGTLYYWNSKGHTRVHISCNKIGPMRRNTVQKVFFSMHPKTGAFTTYDGKGAVTMTGKIPDPKPRAGRCFDLMRFLRDNRLDTSWLPMEVRKHYQ